MADMGLAEFCQFASSLDVDRLIEQFTELESRSAQLQADDGGTQRGQGAASRASSSPCCPRCSSRQPCLFGRRPGLKSELEY